MNSETSGNGATVLSPRRKSVLIIDDHVMVRQGLAALINQEEDLFVAGQAGDAARGQEAVETSKPDIVLLDISLPGMNGIELLKILKVIHPELPVLMLTMHDESFYEERALDAGAIGYVRKTADTKEFMAALRRGLRGESRMGKTVAATRSDPAAGRKRRRKRGSTVADLTRREREIYQLIGRGIGTGNIARMLSISVKTVDAHRARIKQRLHLRTAPELVRHAVRHIEASNQQ